MTPMRPRRRVPLQRPQLTRREAGSPRDRDAGQQGRQPPRHPGGSSRLFEGRSAGDGRGGVFSICARGGPRNIRKGSCMTTDQKRARWFGVLYLITFVTSIPAALLYQPVLDTPVAYISGAGHDKRILFGAFLELLLIIANIGTAVVIFPIMRRRYEDLAIGYVAARIFECTFILVGILAVLGIITLRLEVAGGAEGTVAYTLAAIKDWTFL